MIGRLITIYQLPVTKLQNKVKYIAAFSKYKIIAVSKTTFQAIQFMLISVSSFAVMNILVKYLEAIPPFELTFFRAFGSFVIGTILILKKGIPILGNQRKLLTARGLVGVTAMVTFFWAIKLLPFASAVSLRYLAPIFAAILAIYFLKERITPLQWGCFIMAFLGVLILKGFDLRISIFGLGVILFSASLSGVVYVLIRKIGQRDHSLVIVNYFMFIAMMVGLIFSIFNWVTPQPHELLILLSLGIFGFAGQIFMTKAYQIAAIGTVAPFKYLESVFALLVGWVWFGEQYSLIALLGIALILGGMFLNIMVKNN